MKFRTLHSTKLEHPLKGMVYNSYLFIVYKLKGSKLVQETQQGLLFPKNEKYQHSQLIIPCAHRDRCYVLVRENKVTSDTQSKLFVSQDLIPA